MPGTSSKRGTDGRPTSMIGALKSRLYCRILIFDGHFFLTIIRKNMGNGLCLSCHVLVIICSTFSVLLAYLLSLELEDVTPFL